jgi:V8-like Glu-specific endopeptidase
VLRLPAGKRAVITVAAVIAIGAAAAFAAESALAGASPHVSVTRSTNSSTVGVVYQVPAAAQTAARSYWTPSRMAAAVTPIVPQSARIGSAPAPRSTGQARAAYGPKASKHHVAIGAPAGTPSSSSFGGVPTIGALFYTNGTGKHFCTASVLNTSAGSILITAAHCVYAGSFAHDLEFVPGYANGMQPYGDWTVTQITVAKSWQQHEDPNVDVAFLNAQSSGATSNVYQVTGGLNIAFAMPDWQKHITVIGYNDTDQRPIQCTTNSFRFRHLQMEFYCSGFWFGTSGGPWIIGYNSGSGTGTVFGVIGGYEWGGYKSWASYSAAFEQPARALLRQAVSAAKAS